MEKQILFFTSKTCGPCQRFLREQAPELISKNWGVNEKEDSLIRVVDVDENPELFNKYKSQDAVPTFCLVKNGVKVKDLVGYRTAKDLTDLWYQN
jgi:thiol-disulfide isomerase/thioredoxin